MICKTNFDECCRGETTDETFNQKKKPNQKRKIKRIITPLHKMKTIKPAITFLLLIISGALFAQNPVTFIPPDPAKGGPAAAPVKTDTIITVLDAAKNYRRVVVLQK
ncbi:MAG: hypothetical protein IPI65_08490 [Bacteroidetes bacterium]|nr:hypothetical protein [Bacteroidota bacterium]